MTKKNINLYLLSDSTGETVLNVSRAVFAHFDNIEVKEHLWSLVRTRGQVDKLLLELSKSPGIVMFTLANQELKNYLQESCTKIHVLSLPILDEIINTLSSFLKIKIADQPGRQHALDDDYFKRMNAINFSLAHDDGQMSEELEKAEIILVGPSRTSKSPTAIYLAYRGFKTANIPLVFGHDLPDEILKLKNPLIVGLYTNYERLIEIRKNRLANLETINSHNYIDQDFVLEELQTARKIYIQNKWPMIDVSRKSVEETAANIIELYRNRERKQ